MKVRYLLSFVCVFLTACYFDDEAKSDTKSDDENIIATQPQEATKSEDELPRYNIGVTNIDSRPLVSRDKNGELEGFDIDLLNEIARINNVSFSYNTLPNDLMFTLLEQDEVSMIANQITDALPNIDDYLVSKPYLEAYPITIVTKGKGLKQFSELKGMTVAIKSNMSETQRVILEEAVKKENIKIVKAKSDWIAVQKVLIGDVDAAIGNSAIMPYYVSQLSENNLKFYIEHSISKEKYRFLISKKNPELLEIVNAGIDAIISDDNYQNLFRKWF